MDKEKRSVSESKKSESTEDEKRLTSDHPESELTPRLSGQEPRPEETSEPQGNTLKARIRNSTLAGGLRKIPENFEDADGDWTVGKSENVFERLYLDYREHKSITPTMVDRNYQILHEFWTQKIDTMHTGANRVKIIRKYAGAEGSERTIINYSKVLKQAYDRLSQPNGIETCYFQIEEQRQEMIRMKLEPIIMLTLNDKILEPSEEVTIKNYCRAQTDLSEEEIDEIIEEYLNKTNSKKGEGGGGIAEFERLFFHQIKKKLPDGFLSLEDEEDLISDSEVYNITAERHEELVLQALREIDESEREKTFEQDKWIFGEFYYGLLRDFGLTDDENLPEPAKEKSIQRDNSKTEFFPLNQEHRRNLIQETVKNYKVDLEAEEKRFFGNALQNLDQYDGHIEAKQEMMADVQYLLLLPVMRQDLITKAIDQIIEKQSDRFTEAAKKYYQIKHWKLPEKKVEEFIAVPDQLPHTKGLRHDWLEKERRVFLFSDVTQWGDEQHKGEISIMTEQIRKELKKYIYGLPLDLEFGQIFAKDVMLYAI